MSNKLSLLAGTICGGLALLAADLNNAYAQGINEIVVTARKREESLQSVPLTVTALTRDFLADAQIEDTFSLASFTPGLTFEDLGQRYQSKPIIRGLTTNSVAATQQKNSSFIDGIYVGGTTSSLPLIAYDRVEVLKGPQSAAFGRATFGGAINYVTRDPGEEFDVRVSAKAATDDDYSFGVSVGGPIVQDQLFAQVIAYYDTWDGNEEWINSDGTKLGTRQTEFAMGKAIWQPTPDFELELSMIYSLFTDGPSQNQFAAPEQRNGVFPGGNFPLGVVTTPTRPYDQDFSVNDDPGVEIEKTRYSAQLTWDIAGHTITALGAYNMEDSSVFISDIANRVCRAPGRDVSAFSNTTCSKQDQNYKDWQIEARIESPQDQRFRYLFGGYYIDLQQEQFFYQPITGALFFDFDPGDYESWSIFGALEFDVTEQLTIGFEGRFNHDNVKVLDFPNCFPLLSNGTVSGFLESFCPGDAARFTGVPTGDPSAVFTETFTKFLPRVTVDYQATEDMLLYALASLGNQPGGFNTGLPPELTVVDEESIWNYEIGAKTTWLDGRLVVNIAAFRMDWTDQVFRRTVALPSVIPGDPPQLFVANVNEGDSRIYGVELETFFQPFDGLDLRGTLAYTRARYKEFCSQFLNQLLLAPTPPFTDCVSVEGNRLETQPDWDASISATYTQPLLSTGWEWYSRADFNFQGTKFASEMNLAETGSAKLLNLRVGVQNERFNVEVFGTNLTDDETPTRLSRLTDFSLFALAPGTGANNTAFVPRRGRQFGIRASANF